MDQWLGETGPVELSPLVTRLLRLVVGIKEGGGLSLQADEVAFGITKMIVMLVFAVCAVFILIRATKLEDAFAPMMVILCLVSPILHPWYLLWVLPFAILSEAHTPTWWSRPVIIWTLLAWLAYLPRPTYLETGVWEAWAPYTWLQYLPVWGLIMWNVWHQKLKGAWSPSQVKESPCDGSP
tara:strand:- start:358 stop:900 length:543 start_codon:yes stop_codon:yes gene_type:complete